VAAIRHYKKNAGTNAMLAGGGSIGFAALARVMIAALPNPQSEEEGSYFWAIAKNNLVRPEERAAILYRIVSSPKDDTIGCIEWGNLVEMSANDILEEQAKVERDEKRSKNERVDKAITFLENYLPFDQPMNSKEMYEIAEEKYGLTKANLKAAKELTPFIIKVEKEKGVSNPHYS
jgi:hypothetical protein